MTSKTQLGDVMETSCPHCGSRYRISDNQLQAALGRVKCGECEEVFNALQSLKSYEGKLPPDYQPKPLVNKNSEAIKRAAMANSRPAEPAESTERRVDERRSDLSLHEAMYGHERNSLASFAPFLWFIGILMLVVIGIAQVVYYHRYQLIDKPRYQQQVLKLCELVPCAELEFSSISQIKLLERNVFTHPVTSGALMVSGSFVNQAPFPQKFPDMLVSLFDIRGDLIANRVFEPAEYLQNNKNIPTLETNKPVQFRLEIVDPGTDALTYEFEFF